MTDDNQLLVPNLLFNGATTLLGDMLFTGSVKVPDIDIAASPASKYVTNSLAVSNYVSTITDGLSGRIDGLAELVNTITASLLTIGGSATNGYQKLPSGLMFQWGRIDDLVTDIGRLHLVEFSQQYQANPYTILLTPITSEMGQTPSAIELNLDHTDLSQVGFTLIKQSITPTGFTFKALNTTNPYNITNFSVNWLAIGY